MRSIPHLFIFATLALFLTFPSSQSTSGEPDEVLRKLEQLDSTQKRQMQQMQLELDKVHRKLNSTQVKLDLMTRSAVQSKKLFSQSSSIH